MASADNFSCAFIQSLGPKSFQNEVFVAQLDMMKNVSRPLGALRYPSYFVLFVLCLIIFCYTVALVDQVSCRVWHIIYD